MVMKRVLTIAGSDSGGGAGIQADLKVITALGAYGMSAITALTAQNTTGVQGIHEVPASFVAEQIDSVLSDIGADAIKTGMLANPDVVRVVAAKIRQYRPRTVVVDPVMVAKSGDLLLRKEAQKSLISDLIPLATVVTPNLMEASVLAGFPVRSVEQMKAAGRRIHAMGAKNVVIKGGHLKGAATDLLYDGSRFYPFTRERVESENTHGTGCTFASAVSTLLAQGNSVPDAVGKAKELITQAIRAGIPLGSGTGPANAFASVLREMARYRVLQELNQAMKSLKEGKLGSMIPEVSSNLGYALPHAAALEDVAAFPGRIVRFGDSVSFLAGPEFGASRHVAKIILTAMRFHAELCAAMNIRYSRETVALLKKKGFRVAQFDRRKEPRTVKDREGSSLEWGVGEVLKRSGEVPDFIYDRGDVGKEPMIRVLGRSPSEVIEKVLKAKG
jgi:hydroxymethylpyrimidine kinase / phosphomethylpyrimidine kinase / thiamine-phosphate diphosphorylase